MHKKFQLNRTFGLLRIYFVRPAGLPAGRLSRLIIRLTSAHLSLAGAWADLDYIVLKKFMDQR